MSDGGESSYEYAIYKPDAALDAGEWRVFS